MEVAIAGLIVFAIIFAIYVAIHYYRNYHGLPDARQRYNYDIKQTLIKPYCYFFGGQCPVCRRYYFSRKKAFKCCPGPHNNFLGDTGKTMRYLHPNTRTGGDRWDGIGGYYRKK